MGGQVHEDKVCIFSEIVSLNIKYKLLLVNHSTSILIGNYNETFLGGTYKIK